jgi:pantoate--beta-alanine ligase
MSVVVKTVAEVRQQFQGARLNGKILGLVPTMGALHAGHARLIEVARGESDVVVVSIFVNPLQFGPSEDYTQYPRPLAADLELCERMGADVVFVPSSEEVYRSSQLTFVEVTRLTDHLCGKFRPGHFRGVTTVVSKLFNIVQPDRAYFGEKDFQQLAVIRRMTIDLNMPIAIVGVPTVRETDGLALSSRNRYLDEGQRKVAIGLYRALLKAQELIRSGEKDSARVRESAIALLKRDPGIRLEYFEIVDPEEVQPVKDAITGPVRIAGAVWVGNTRLIDNVSV